MGLTRIDDQPKMSASEWERREMRRHNIKMWLITLGEIALIAGLVYLMLWLGDEVHL